MNELSLGDAVTLFLGNYKVTSANSYKSELVPMSVWIGAARPVDAINNVELLTYVAREINAKDYSQSTRRKKIKALKTFFRWLNVSGFIAENPATALRTPPEPRTLTREKAMTEEHAAELVRYAAGLTVHSGKRHRDLALFLFMYDTGVRVGEAAGLTLHDVNLNKREAYITGKGERDHVVRYASYTDEALREWLDRREGGNGAGLWHPTGRKMQAASVSQIIRRACKILGIPSYGGHSLRHALGHRAADAGIPVTQIQALLGHASMNSTKHYLPSDAETAWERAQMLGMQKPKLVQFDTKKRA